MDFQLKGTILNNIFKTYRITIMKNANALIVAIDFYKGYK